MELIRSYFPSGTNGELFHLGEKICSTIELPWKNNEPRVSCIPEGKYELIERYSLKLGWHLQIKDVKNRNLILIHPANDAMKELKGCIAPVTYAIAPGKGSQSRLAFKKVYNLVKTELHKKKQFLIIIKSKENVSLANSIN